MALVVVLWIVASLALLVSAFNASVRTTVALAGSELALARGQAMAHAAVAIAAARLLDSDPERRWRAGESVHELVYSGARLRLRITDESGRIDLNQAKGALIEGLLGQLVETHEEARALTESILDWRDSDHDRRMNGAEDADYRRRGRQAGAGDADFRDATELLQVLGMSYALYRRLAPFVTVYGRDGRINLETAPREALSSIPGITEREVEEALRARDQGEAGALTLSALRGRFGKWLGSKPGPAYRLHIEVASAGTEAVARARVTILLSEMGKTPIHVLDWRAYAPRLGPGST